MPSCSGSMYVTDPVPILTQILQHVPAQTRGPIVECLAALSRPRKHIAVLAGGSA